MNDINFIDFQVLSPKTAIVLYDGVVVKKHSNIPSISSHIYSISKLIMWNLWYYTSSRMSYFTDGGCRLAISDTG